MKVYGAIKKITHVQHAHGNNCKHLAAKVLSTNYIVGRLLNVNYCQIDASVSVRAYASSFHIHFKSNLGIFFALVVRLGS